MPSHDRNAQSELQCSVRKAGSSPLIQSPPARPQSISLHRAGNAAGLQFDQSQHKSDRQQKPSEIRNELAAARDAQKSGSLFTSKSNPQESLSPRVSVFWRSKLLPLRTMFHARRTEFPVGKKTIAVETRSAQRLSSARFRSLFHRNSRHNCVQLHRADSS